MITIVLVSLLLAAPPSVAAPASVTGTVVAQDGKPVAGATVALVEEGQGALATVTRTDAAGRFSIDTDRPGRYGVTATHEAHAAAFRCGLVLEASRSASVQLALGGPGLRVSGRVLARGNRRLEGQRLVVPRLSEQPCDEFHVAVGIDGRFAVRLPAGRYSFQLLAASHAGPAVDREITRDEVIDLPVDPAAEVAPPPAEVTRWLREHAIPLHTAAPKAPLDDLAPLLRVVGDARVVALGEATHGSRELFQLKHRVLELLVERAGFTAFAIEATMPEGFDVDAYVQTGKGDPGRALSGLYFWTWNTEEVLDLVRWMRAYNADPRHARKLHFYGFDMQSPQRAARVVRAYLARVAPEEATAAKATLGALLDPLALPRAPDELSRATAAVARLARWLDANRGDCVGTTGADAFALARQHARVLEQYLAMATSQGNGARDRAMADNVRWILEREGPAGKVVVWAHNAHVATHGDFGVEWMGLHLRRALGSALVVLGFAFDRGRFQAVGATSDRALSEWTVGPAPAHWLDGALARTGLPLLALDLRAVPQAGVVADWFAARRPARSIGAVFDPAHADAYVTSEVPARAYDGLLFVAETTAARPRFPRKAPRPPGEPVNLQLDASPSGSVPVGWDVRDDARDHGYHVVTRSAGCRKRRCAMVERWDDQPHYGEAAAGLRQRIDASPYRGKRIRLHAWASLEASDADASARVFIAHAGRELVAPARAREASEVVRGEPWHEYTPELDVPADAVSLSLGLELGGSGRAFLDEVWIEVPRSPRPAGAAPRAP